VENNYYPLNIRFVAKTSDIRNFSQNIRSDVKTSEVATLVAMFFQLLNFALAIILPFWTCILSVHGVIAYLCSA